MKFEEWCDLDPEITTLEALWARKGWDAHAAEVRKNKPEPREIYVSKDSLNDVYDKGYHGLADVYDERREGEEVIKFREVLD